MKRLKSNLLNMVLSLTLVTLVAAAMLGGLYVLTEEPIQKQKAEKQQSAITSVLPAVEGLRIADPEDKGNGTIVYRAFDKDDQFAGAAVQTEENGFGGKFKVMVGFDKDGNVVNYEVLEHQETPGLGDHMTDWFKTDKNRQSIIGRNTVTTNFTVSKDGGDVDAITAATISSRAFLSAVVKAYNALNENGVSAWSGAYVIQSLEEEQIQQPDSIQPADTAVVEEPVQVETEKPQQETPQKPKAKKKLKKAATQPAEKPQAEPVAAETAASVPVKTEEPVNNENQQSHE